MDQYSSDHVNIEANVSLQSVFTGAGLLSHVTIWKDVDGGTVQLFDANDQAIFPAGVTDYPGSFNCSKKVWNGCKITTTGFTGGRLTFFFSKQSA